LRGLYKVKSANLKPLIYKVKKMLSELNSEKINFISVTREKNKLADKLVNLELNKNFRKI